MKKLSITLFAVIALVALNSPGSVLADEPGIWRKTDGVNEITPALTEGTTTFEDDEGSEFVHEVQSWAGPNFPTALDALNWVNINITYTDDAVNYGVVEAWANPEQTLDQGSGDSEDMVFLLASLLKFHTDEVDEDDLVYAVCGFVFPPVDGFHAWVYWYDASAIAWHQLDPTIPAMNGLLYPALGTLWLNDEHVWGFLPGYYPGPLPSVAGYDRDDFVRIAEDGFDDPMNNYAWSMGYFNGDLYVGVGRNSTWGVINGMGLPPEITDPIYEQITVPRGTPGSWEFANDMRGEIWRYHDGEWEQVYQASVFELPAQPGVYVPSEIGFRGPMATFTDKWDEEAIYTARAAALPPNNVIFKSTDGVTWERVRTPSILCDSPPYMGNPRAMAVHNGKLYVGAGEAGTTGGGPFIWATDDPVAATGLCSPAHNWTLVADFSVPGPGTNTAIGALASFNGYLYAGVDNRETGFQVWRSNASDPSLGSGWKKIVDYGAGDMHNWRAACMDVLEGRLYVGSLSLPGPGDDPGFMLPKGFEIIRIDTSDDWGLVVGDYFPQVPAPGVTIPRMPISRWPGGFGNMLNFYCWSMQVHEDVLYIGSFDASFFLHFVPIGELIDLELTEEQQERIIAALEEVIELLEELEADEVYIEPFRRLLEVFESESIDWEEVGQVFIDYFTGADLWKTEDGLRWEPVTLNGFDNPNNYGFRNMVGINPLFVGTANPFDGLEIWAAPQFILTVNKAGSGTGTVASDLAGILCGADCTETYGYGTVVTLTAHPSVKSYFVGWRGDCSGTGLTTQVTMDANKTCIATFSYPVGGIVVPVNKLRLVAPWMGLVTLAGLAGIGVVLVRRRMV